MLGLRSYRSSKDICVQIQLNMFRKMSVIKSEISTDNADTRENGNVTEETARFSEEEIARKRNKSRLRLPDRNRLYNEPPHQEACDEHHSTVKYMSRMYGTFGEKSGVDPRICWPSSDKIMDLKEYESLARPHTLQEMIKINVDTKAAEVESIQKREEEVAEKFAKLDKLKSELNARIKHREDEAIAAKAKKDRLIEEVRRHFGFKVDPKEERFKEMIEKKEKEERKLAKEAKKKAKEAKAISGLLELSGQMDVQKPT